MEWLFLLLVDFFEGGALAGDEMGGSLLTVKSQFSQVTVQ